MNGISWQNLMMMNLVIPSTEGSSGDGKSAPAKNSMSLFEIGDRLAKGQGV